LQKKQISIEACLDDLFQEMIDFQKKRVLSKAQALDPRLTEDDVLQPHDVKVLRNDATWNYEDGVLAGYLSAQIAVRVKLRLLDENETGSLG